MWAHTDLTLMGIKGAEDP